MSVTAERGTQISQNRGGKICIQLIQPSPIKRLNYQHQHCSSTTEEYCKAGMKALIRVPRLYWVGSTLAWPPSLSYVHPASFQASFAFQDNAPWVPASYRLWAWCGKDQPMLQRRFVPCSLTRIIVVLLTPIQKHPCLTSNSQTPFFLAPKSQKWVSHSVLPFVWTF